MARAAKCRSLLFWNNCLDVVVVGWPILSLCHTPLGSMGQGNHPPLKKVGAAVGPVGPNGGKEVEQSGKSDFYNSPLDNKRGSQRVQSWDLGDGADGNGPRESKSQAGWTSGWGVQKPNIWNPGKELHVLGPLWNA